MEHFPAGGKLHHHYRRFFLALSFLLLASLYLALAADLAAFGALWSPDSGARLAMVRNWLEHGSLIYLHYSGGTADPTAQLHPLGGYALLLPQGICTTYPPLFPLLSGAAYWLLGWAGLLLLPLLAGLGTALLLYIIGRRLGLRCGIILPLVGGLATPLALYSVVFWDPAIQVLLTAAAGYWLLRALEEGRARAGVIAGALLGLGVWFHETFIVLFAALVLTSWSVWKTRRAVVPALLVGFVLMAALWAGGNWLLYGSLTGPHVMGPNNLMHPFHLGLMLDPGHLVARGVRHLAGDPTESPFPRVLAALLLAGLLWSLYYERNRTALPLLYLLAAGVALTVLLQAQWANGLFGAAPVLIPAVTAASSAGHHRLAGVEETPRLLFFAWIGPALIVYMLLVIVNPITPSLEWGSRYLLVGLPWLALVAAHGLERDFTQADDCGRRALLVAVASFIGVSFFSQYRGFLAIRSDMERSRAFVQAAERVTTRVQVTDVWWLGAELTPARLRQAQFLVEDEADRVAFFSGVERLGAREFTYLGTSEGLTRLLRTATEQGRPFRVTEDRLAAGLRQAHLSTEPVYR